MALGEVPGPLSFSFLIWESVIIKPPGQVVVPIKCHKAHKVLGTQWLLKKCHSLSSLSYPYILKLSSFSFDDIKEGLKNGYIIGNIYCIFIIFQEDY